ELREKVRPYVLRRRTRDCFDLPEILEPITIEARLSEDTWKMYKSMRDEMLVILEGEASIAKQAIVKGLRLAQITSGFLGGIQKFDIDWSEDLGITGTGEVIDGGPPKEIGREKLDTLLAWLATIEQPERILIWSRF